MHYKKSFILSNTEINDRGFNSLIFNDFYLFYTEDLNIKKIKDVILIGYAISTVDESVEQLFNKLDEGLQNIEEVLFYLSGKYIVIYKNKLYLDAYGLIGVFYYSNNEKWYITNDLTFYEDHLKLNRRIIDVSWERHDLINYMPAPLTVFDNVFMLLNTKYLSFNGRTLSVEECILSEKKYKLNDKKIIEQIKCIYEKMLKQVEKDFENIYLSLTAGYDSRLTFSLAINSKINFYTFSHFVPNFKGEDKTIPEILSKKYEKKYYFLEPKDFNQNLLEEYNNFLCGSVDDANKYIYSNNIDFPNCDTDCVLKSNIYELVILYYSKLFTMKKITKEKFMNKLIKKQPTLKGSIMYDSLSLWYDNLPTNITKDDFVTKFYKEQRIGAWVSYNERGYDLYNSTVLNLSNCKYIMSLFLSFKKSLRKHKNHQRKIINNIDSFMDKLKYNNLSKKDILKIRIKSFIKNILEI